MNVAVPVILTFCWLGLPILLQSVEIDILRKRVARLSAPPATSAPSVKRVYVIAHRHVVAPIRVEADNCYVEEGWLWVVDKDEQDVVAYPAKMIDSVKVELAD